MRTRVRPSEVKYQAVDRTRIGHREDEIQDGEKTTVKPQRRPGSEPTEEENMWLVWIRVWAY